ncbi:hypothetical protein FRC03_008015 [Tulasnella sp. 419]|nr:hypothetical protein FRC03_008015 [Tulasnella sp. 419]
MTPFAPIVASILGIRTVMIFIKAMISLPSAITTLVHYLLVIIPLSYFHFIVFSSLIVYYRLYIYERLVIFSNTVGTTWKASGATILLGTTLYTPMTRKVTESLFVPFILHSIGI